MSKPWITFTSINPFYSSINLSIYRPRVGWGVADKAEREGVPGVASGASRRTSARPAQGYTYI